MLSLLLTAACRMGLPPEPPERDAANPEAATPRWKPSPDPYTTSAFEGVQLPKDEGHHHHHHHGQAKTKEAGQ